MNAPLEAAALTVLSPHLDDAVLSCGALLARRAARGLRTLVCTAMTHGGPRDPYTQRHEEDARALALLRCERAELGVADAPARGHQGYEAIVFGQERPDAAVRSALHDALARALSREKPDALLIPLGVGGHIDHRLCFEVARALASAPTLVAYEDRPYALVDDATDARLHQLGLGARAPWSDERLEHHARALASAPYFTSYTSAGPLRARILTRTLDALRHGSTATSFLLEPLEPLVASEREAWAAREAALAYESQFEALLRDAARYEALDRAHARARGYDSAPRIERYFAIERATVSAGGA